MSSLDEIPLGVDSNALLTNGYDTVQIHMKIYDLPGPRDYCRVSCR